MWIHIVLMLVLIVNCYDCRGAGPPGSEPDLRQPGGSPGSIGRPGVQLVFPPNPDVGRLMKIDDPADANAKHIFSDPRGPMGYIDENGEFVPFGHRSSDIRSKTQQGRQEPVDNNDWTRVEEESDNKERSQTNNDRSRASVLYNMFSGHYQPGPQINVPQTQENQPAVPGPQGPPRDRL